MLTHLHRKTFCASAPRLPRIISLRGLGPSAVADLALTYSQSSTALRTVSSSDSLQVTGDHDDDDDDDDELDLDHMDCARDASVDCLRHGT